MSLCPRWLMACGCALGLLAGSSPLAQVATEIENPYAVCAHLARGGEHQIARDELRLMKAAGIGWARTDFDWSGVEKKQGEWTFDHLDETVQWAEAAGVKILPILDYDVAWARPAYKHPDLWLEYVRRVVTRYKARLRHWEVWNEQNLEGFWREKPAPANYAKLLKATYREIKAIDPELTVLIGGFAGIPWPFIEGVYAAGGGPFFDVMNVHPYRYPARPGPGKLFRDLERLRATMATHGDGDKPIWITEIGWPTHADPIDMGALMKGIVKSGLHAIDPTRKTWSVAMLDDREYPRGFTAEGAETARRMLQPTPVRTVALADLPALDPAVTQVLVMPPDEAFPGPQFGAIESFVRRGGVVVLWSGVPLYYEMKPTADGKWAPAGASEGFRQRLHIGWEAWWTKDGVPKEIKQVRAARDWDGSLPFPAKSPVASRFLTPSALAAGDRFVPLIQAQAGEYMGTVAAAYALDSDLKGGVIVSTFRRIGRNVTAERQGMICPRAYLVALQAGVERMFWYEFQAVEHDPFYNEHHFGMVHRDLSPKPAYTAVTGLTRARPAGSKPVETAWRDGKGLYFPHWQRPDGQLAWALWRDTGSAACTLRVTGTIAQAFDHLGRPRPVALKNGGATIEINESILYLVGPESVVVTPVE
ncbi:MAG: hypothetical protein HN849_03480 [Victivallales bacterium]|nr:hypothetical protein [Victivallales bacterium]